LVGIHIAIELDVAESSVIFIAKIKDDEIVSHHYLLELNR